MEAVVIELDKPEWVSPILLVTKTDSIFWLFAAYRRLNVSSIPGTYPFPPMDD